MRYRLDRICRHPDGTVSGVLTCLDAAPGPTGPDRVPVARYAGPLLAAPGIAPDAWQPAGSAADHPERWQDL